jgi:lambda repressor-like predicted transcriptional regulator
MANDELTELCASLHRSGVSVRELSQAAGVTYRAMARRLGR